MIEIPDLLALSDRDLGNFIRDLRLRIVACEARLESPAAARQRTVKLARGTFLAVGGLFGMSLEPFAAVVLFVGLWDWADALVNDAATMNQQLKLRRDLSELDLAVGMAEAEFQRRSTLTVGKPE